jgi:hypothetical protein
VSEKDVKKYMRFAKKNNIKLFEAITRYIKSNKISVIEDIRVVYSIASMVYESKEIAA